ncbi:hypothetical protein [Neobacillus jeddahensis]|uniref:hypothetical protein n=1 Tax=Neobacillus jeddahensis TaxID=1461580 RepID=UPI0006944ABB|nr:hypothetical protein [Neobacillus jeddahensis]
MRKRTFTAFKRTAPLLCTVMLFACSHDSESPTLTNSSASVDINKLGTIGKREISDVIANTVSYKKADQ